MRVLIVDDEAEFTDTLLARIEERGLDVQSLVVRSRASALDALDAGDFDYMVCDLRIPTVDGALDADLAHGQDVYAAARRHAPGLPILVLSAHGDDATVAEMSELAPHDDPFGQGAPKPMLQYVPKRSDLEGALTRIEAASTGLAALQGVDLSPSPEHLVVPDVVQRVLRIFSRLRGGQVVRFSTLSGGLSESHVLRVRVEEADGALAIQAVAKIAPIPDVDDEVRRYDQITVLPPGLFTPLVNTVRAGAARHGGAFYSLDEGFDRSLFEMLLAQPDLAAGAVARLKDGTRAWREGRPVSSVSVGEIRRVLLPDDRLDGVREELEGTDWEDTEAIAVQARRCRQHGDLHGLNVLVNGAGEPRMIDFGRVGDATAALDPVTLELSLLFHPDHPDLGGGWPTPEQLSDWGNRPGYLEECPVPAYVDACRTWAFDVAGSNAEVFATVYAYAVRQLSFPATDRARALRLIEAATLALRA